MSKTKLNQDLIALMPRARRYGRALVGATENADTLIAAAAKKVIQQAPSSALLTPTTLILPWLFIELHKILDEDKNAPAHRPSPPADSADPILYEQFDRCLDRLSDDQKRVYLMTSLEQFSWPVSARVLRLSVGQVSTYFAQAHKLISDHMDDKVLNASVQQKS